MRKLQHYHVQQTSANVSDWKQVSEQNLQDEIILSVRKDSRKRVRWLLRTTYSTAKLHWLKCIHIQERIRLGVRKPLRSARVCVCVCVCSVVLHPAVLLDESIDHLLHGQIGDQLILGQRAAGHWVKMANTLQRERIFLFSSLKA